MRPQPAALQYGAANARSDLLLKLYLLLKPSLLAKRHAGICGEPGRSGTLVACSSGVRAAGTIDRRLDWELEAALQRGRVAGGAVRVRGAVGQASWPAASAADPWRWTVGYAFGSGDADPADGLKATFDTLYPATHLRNGATDRIGRANINWTLQAECRRSRRLRFSWSTHDFWLSALRDAMYLPGSAPLIRYPLAAGRHVGSELASCVDYQLSSSIALRAGCAHPFPGPFLRHSGRSGATQPHVFLSYRFEVVPRKEGNRCH